MTAVQRQMKDHSDELWKLLQSQNSYLYISGKRLEEASSDWLMISKCIEFILIIYIYIIIYLLSSGKMSSLQLISMFFLGGVETTQVSSFKKLLRRSNKIGSNCAA
jgi:hypothetical protein